MNTYEIEVYGYSVNAETITAILEALTAAGIDNYNAALEADNNSVYVDPSDVGAAVAVINGLGFETDEDEA